VQPQQRDKHDHGKGAEDELTGRSDAAVDPEPDERPDGYGDERDDSCEAH
jgi:hypothetical protein